MAQIVDNIPLVAHTWREDDGSVTMSLDGLDIVAHGDTLQTAKAELAENMAEYAEEYYQEFALYSRAPNRKAHLPYVIRALIAKSPKELEDAIICREGGLA